VTTFNNRKVFPDADMYAIIYPLQQHEPAARIVMHSLTWVCPHFLAEQNVNNISTLATFEIGGCIINNYE